jgi:hypothetical protein
MPDILQPRRRLNLCIDEELDRQIDAAAAQSDRTKASEAKHRLKRSFEREQSNAA